MENPFRYFVIHKPYGMESQFKPNYPGALLGDLDFDFPPGTHAVGRLDKTSEGLLLLTTDKRITKLLFQGAVPHSRRYLVQVKGKVTEEALLQLQQGVSIRISDDEWYTTPPCDVVLADAPSAFPSPVAQSDHLQSSWLHITLAEGKFRQVRKMVFAVRHRCLRLIRTSIEDLHLETLQPGAVKELSKETFFRLLRLEQVAGKA